MSKKIYNSGNPKDSSGKKLVHETSCHTGRDIYFTSRGDDIADITKVGGGTWCEINHEISGDNPEVVYVDFNFAENDSWMHEGYAQWENCDFDSVDFGAVPLTVSGHAASNTNYNIYGDYLVIPASGDGTWELDSDWTDPRGGLVNFLESDLPLTSPRYWDADYNSTTHEYENLTAAPSGNGNFNMFSTEVWLAKFAHDISLLNNGFIKLQSADAERLGQGMRLKLIGTTRTPDHAWKCSFILTLHRTKTC